MKFWRTSSAVLSRRGSNAVLARDDECSYIGSMWALGKLVIPTWSTKEIRTGDAAVEPIAEPATECGRPTSSASRRAAPDATPITLSGRGLSPAITTFLPFPSFSAAFGSGF